MKFGNLADDAKGADNERTDGRTQKDDIIISHCEIALKIKSMYSPGTWAIRTQCPPSKPKREINKITNSQNTKRSTEWTAISKKVATQQPNLRFSCKLDVIFPTFHTSVKRRKISFNS